MITIEQANLIGKVYNKFLQIEDGDWTNFDDSMEMLAWLSDREVATEAELVLRRHKMNGARCKTNHPAEECFVPVVIEAASYISQDFETSQRLAKKARYVLEFYIAMAYTGSIISD